MSNPAQKISVAKVFAGTFGVPGEKKGNSMCQPQRKTIDNQIATIVFSNFSYEVIGYRQELH